jgi:mannose-6-phosphate isomerase-like protein (cupin superfamily)
MSLPDIPESDFSPSPALQRVVRCLAADVAATEQASHRVAPPAGSGDLSYLDRLIRKPWGSEFRVYEDALTDVWCLHIGSRHRTSLHCHPRKLTAQLCLEGAGTLTTYGGVQYALEPGVVLRIQPGAYHRIAASSTTGLRLIEVETPKGKLDLLRIEDDYRDVAEPYEGEQFAVLGLVTGSRATAVPLALQPLMELPLRGHRRARLRAQCSSGRYGFAVETGARVMASMNLVFAIALEPHHKSSADITVLGAGRPLAADPQSIYLTIRAL